MKAVYVAIFIFYIATSAIAGERDFIPKSYRNFVASKSRADSGSTDIRNLSEKDREIIARGEIGTARYLTGGVLGIYSNGANFTGTTWGKYVDGTFGYQFFLRQINLSLGLGYSSLNLATPNLTDNSANRLPVTYINSNRTSSSAYSPSSTIYVELMGGLAFSRSPWTYLLRRQDVTGFQQLRIYFNHVIHCLGEINGI